MSHFDGYTAVERLHAGERSVVYRAVRVRDGARVVLKLAVSQHPSLAERERIRREYTIGVEAVDAKVVQYLSIEPQASGLALVCEDFDGVALRAAVHKDGVSLGELFTLGDGLLACVESLHEIGITHGAVSPDNVLCSARTGELRLCDLSNAFRGDVTKENNGFSYADRSLTYISPEQTFRTSHAVDHRCDLYGAGLTLFELAAGRPAFMGEPAEVLHKHLAGAVPDLCDVRSDVPAALAAVVTKLMAKSPDERYRSAQAARVDWERCWRAWRRGDAKDVVLGRHDLVAELTVPSRLIGREKEREVLVEALRHAAGGRVGAVILSGPSGVGKSALIESVREPCVSMGGYYCHGKYSDVQETVSYGALGAALRGLLREQLTESDERLDAHRARYANAVGANGALVTRLWPELGHILGAQPEVVALPAVEAQNRLRFVLRAFVSALAPSGNAVVIALDDWQWADQASVGLIEDVFEGGEAQGILLVVSMRNDPLGEEHPVARWREKFLAKGFAQAVEVEPLGERAVGAMVAGLLSQSEESISELTEYVVSKTRGNPFFIGQLLRSLALGGGLDYDEDNGGWKWDLESEVARSFAGELSQVLATTMHRLAETSREFVNLAAHCTEPFDAGVLAEALKWSTPGLESVLDEAIAMGVLVREEARSAEDSQKSFRFLHDQVRRAAGELLAGEELLSKRLALARVLAERVSGDSRSPVGWLFEAVQHFNAVIERVTDEGERARVAELGRDAAVRAVGDGAYDTALGLVSHALRALGPGAWEERYREWMELNRLRAEVSLLVGDVEGVAQAVDEIVARAREATDALPARVVQLLALTGEYRAKEAVRLAEKVLAEQGYVLGVSPSRADALKAIALTKWRLRGEKLSALPTAREVVDQRALAAMMVLKTISVAAFMAAPDLFPVVAAEIVKITLARGVGADTIVGLGMWAMILVAGFGDIEGATRVSRVSLELAERSFAKINECRALMVHGAFVEHWTHPLRDTFETLRKGHALGLQYGDIETSTISAVSLSSYQLAAGDPLDEVARVHRRYLEELGQLKQERFQLDLVRNLQFIACLRGETADPAVLKGELFDPVAALEKHEREGDGADIALVTYMQGFLAFVFRDYRAALEFISRSLASVESQAMTGFRPPIEFLSGLVSARAEATGVQPRAKALKVLRTALKRLRRWSEYCAVNNAHRVALIEAELARIEDRPMAAVSFYERAISLSAKSGYVQERAFAHELAAEFFFARGEERLGRAHLDDARGAYLAWGATAKVERLDRARGEAGGASSSKRALTTVEEVDLRAVMQAAQAISGEIVLEKLLRRVMALLIQNAGATRGVLFLQRNGVLCAVADGRGEAIEVNTEGRRGVGELTSEVATSAVMFVSRTLETVVYEDVSKVAELARDSFVSKGASGAVLCVPLVTQGSLVGVVYLENTLSPGAFTVGRAEFVKIFAAQAAIALQNAKLYDDLDRALTQQLALTEAQARFVPTEFLKSLNRRDIVEVSLGDNVHKEMSVLFSDIRGFTTIVEGMSPESHIGFINEYIGYMEPAIMASGGFVDSYIGDAIMALFGENTDAAVRAGVRMSEGLKAMNAVRAARSEPAVRMGIGVNTGALTLGTIGGPGRVKCGVIGDPVNVAARVESLTKTYDAVMLVTAETVKRMQEPERVTLRPVDRVVVMGKTTPVELYEVIEAEVGAKRDQKFETVQVLREAMEEYYTQRFEEASWGFARCLEIAPGDVVAKKFRERCELWRGRERPEGWSGVEVLDQK